MENHPIIDAACASAPFCGILQWGYAMAGDTVMAQTLAAVYALHKHRNEHTAQILELRGK